MTTIYTFANLADADQGAETDLRPFGQFYAPSSVATQCYNALFGKGNYDGADANLAANFEMQDNDNTTLVRDSSGNGRNGYFKDDTGTLGGEYSFGTTSDLSYEDGPTGYLPRSLHIPAVASRYDPGEIAFGQNTSTKIDWADIPESQGITMVGWGHMNGTRTPYLFFRRLANSNALAGSVYAVGISAGPNHNPFSETYLYTGAVNAGGSVVYRPPSPYFDPSSWYHYSYTIKDSNRTIFVDGQEVATTTSGYSMSYPSDAGLYMGNNGRLAGLALFSRELSADEIQEAYSGPEPYVQSMPSITGTPTVGDFVTINAGTWNSQNNGSIRYTYKMYSYSDTNGTDQRLEKEVTTYLTAQKILIRGSRLVGRYLSFEISAENDGGTDPLEVYNTGYTAAIGSGTDPTYVSYNALFGYGKHIPDPELQTRMLFDSDPTLEEFQQYGDWTVNNISLTDSNLVNVGPTSYLFKSFNQSVIGQNITFSSPNTYLTITDYTVGSWVKLDTYDPVGVSNVITMPNHSGGWLGLRVSSNASFSTGGPIVSFSWNNEVGLGNWGHIVGRYDTTGFQQSDNSEIYLNSVSKDSVSSTGTWHWQSRSGDIMSRIPGNMADFWWIQRSLSDTEISETYTGPEPVNVVPASISGDFRVGYTLSLSSGVWDSQNNGTMTKTYQWYRADDINGTNLTAIVGETSSTYTLTISDYKKYLTVKERSSNDGGYDELEDTFAIYTPQIALRGGMLMLKAG